MQCAISAWLREFLSESKGHGVHKPEPEKPEYFPTRYVRRPPAAPQTPVCARATGDQLPAIRPSGPSDPLDPKSSGHLAERRCVPATGIARCLPAHRRVRETGAAASARCRRVSENTFGQPRPAARGQQAVPQAKAHARCGTCESGKGFVPTSGLSPRPAPATAPRPFGRTERRRSPPWRDSGAGC